MAQDPGEKRVSEWMILWVFFVVAAYLAVTYWPLARLRWSKFTRQMVHHDDLR